MPTETISVGTKPFESPVWTEVHSLPQFCFCPDVYNGSASGYGWVFSFLVHPHEVLAERQCQLGETSVFSPSISTPSSSLGSSSPHSQCWERRSRLHLLSKGILLSTTVTLFIQINGRPIPQTAGKCAPGKKDWRPSFPMRFSPRFPIGILPEPHPIFRFCISHFRDKMERNGRNISWGKDRRLKMASWVSSYSVVIVYLPFGIQFPHLLPLA